MASPSLFCFLWQVKDDTARIKRDMSDALKDKIKKKENSLSLKGRSTSACPKQRTTSIMLLGRFVISYFSFLKD